ncbi:hypothetical protein Hypma_006384 [Hypsizygus marmoreus]|uniref:Uncharacterized protein n=1 Tax=Hypsizygus marmoreus TaxID=39966 RepID=A0A369K3U1_HYPMA|nr:hypothetical protein Hypma_006384 [Hypsizygus marmoreus]
MFGGRVLDDGWQGKRGRTGTGPKAEQTVSLLRSLNDHYNHGIAHSSPDASTTTTPPLFPPLLWLFSPRSIISHYDLNDVFAVAGAQSSNSTPQIPTTHTPSPWSLDCRPGHVVVDTRQSQPQHALSVPTPPSPFPLSTSSPLVLPLSVSCSFNIHLSSRPDSSFAPWIFLHRKSASSPWLTTLVTPNTHTPTCNAKPQLWNAPSVSTVIAICG